MLLSLLVVAVVDPMTLLLVVLVVEHQEVMAVMVDEQEKVELKVLEVLVQEMVDYLEEHSKVDQVQLVVEVDTMEVVEVKL
jgi:hypothetical protein